MIHCEPIVNIVTANFLYQLIDTGNYKSFLNEHTNVYVHLNSFLKLTHNKIDVHTITFITLWELDKIKFLPSCDDKAELPAIVHANRVLFPDNICAYITKLSEYITLRTELGIDMIKY